MKKIVKLTETDLKNIISKIIDEQKSSCTPKQVTKDIVDSVLPSFKNELKSRFSDLKNYLSKKYVNSDSLSKEISSIVSSEIGNSFNLIYLIGVKSAYASFNIGGQYNQTNDVKKLVDNIFNKLVSVIDSSFTKRQMLKYYVDKDNIDDIKKQTAKVLLEIFRELNRMLLKSEYGLTSMIQEKMGKCSNGDYRAKLNPKGTVEYRVLSYYETKLDSIYKLLDQYV